MGKPIDLSTLIGVKINKLTILSAERKKKNNDKRNKLYVLVQCECGNIKEIQYSAMKSGATVSCGCVHLQTLRNNGYKAARRAGSVVRIVHGQSRTRLYRIWEGIRRRCHNTNDKAYHDYGGRGITVCDEWRNDFMNFYNWAYANGYEENLSLSRIDANGNYEPNNCRWSTSEELANNSKRNRYITLNGETKTIAQWCKYYDINYNTVLIRLDTLKWNEIDAFTKPVHKLNNHKVDVDKRLYNIWHHIKHRCYNPKCHAYKDYGERGIKMCDEWLNNVEVFKTWALANGYTNDLTLDRIDNNKGYSPDNCHWVTAKEQANNKRSNVLITINGETKTMKQWSEIYRIPYHLVQGRIYKSHWDPIRALTTPSLRHSKKEVAENEH